MKYMLVEPLVSFNGMRVGQEYVLEDTPVTRGWEAAGFLEVTSDGEDPAGPGSAEPDAEGGEPERRGDGGKAGGGESEGARTRRHRKASVVDPGGEA